MPGAPSFMRPSPAFLDAVCCAGSTDCCDKDSAQRTFKQFTCCDHATEKCVVTDGKGECAALAAGETPDAHWAEHVDLYGRCPDGGSPIVSQPGKAWECSANDEIYNDSVNKCPTESQCVKDRRPNVNTGVCCFNSGCENWDTCETCVRTEEHLLEVGVDADGNVAELDYTDHACSWLTQGDGTQTAGGRCVRSCSTFEDKACILPHSDAKMCPLTVAWQEGTNYNTGSCERRCGRTGTGRSSRINNGMASWVEANPVLTAVEATECCLDLPGDYCCSWDLTLATHCLQGRVPHGPVCGVPVSGTPNNFFNSGPGVIPPSMGALQASLYNRPPPFMGGFGYPMGGFGYPMGGMGGFGYPMGGFGGIGGGFYAPAMYRDYGSVTSDEEGMKAAQDEQDRMFFYAPAPRGFGMGFGFGMPPPPPPARVDQQPTAFVCSCDESCTTYAYADCCKDYFDHCSDEEKPDWWTAMFPEA